MDINILKEARILSTLEPEELACIAEFAALKSVKESGKLFSVGDDADIFYVIRKGAVGLKLPISIHGKTREISLERLEPGQAIGWSSLVPPYHFTASGYAVADSELLCIDSHSLREIFQNNYKLGFKFMSNLSVLISQRFNISQAMLIRQIQRALDHSQSQEQQ